MAQGPLVENQIDAGWKLADDLAHGGTEVTAAFWVRPSEDGEWSLYLASKLVDEQGPAPAYRAVADALLRLKDPWLSMSEVKVIGANNPITKDVLTMLRQHPGRRAIRSRRPRLGNVETEEVYVYPLGAGGPAPRTQVIGVREENSGRKKKQVEDVIGEVDGLLGDEGFDRRFVELVTSRCGSMEQFQAKYPRVLLQWKGEETAKPQK